MDDSNYIRLAFNLFPPWVIPSKRPDGGIQLSGIFGALIDNVTASLNLTYDAYIPTDGLYGHLFENGSWSGMIGYLQTQQADIAVGPFTLDYDIHETGGEFTPSCEYTFITALTGMKRAFVTKPTPYTKAFEPITWIFIASCIISLAFISTMDTWVNGGSLTFWDVSHNFFVMLQTMLQESTKDRFHSSFARLNGGMWLLVTFVLMQLFSSDLKANMVVKAPTMRIKSLEDIIEKKWLQIAYPIQSPIASILESTPGAFGDRVRAALAKQGVPRYSRNMYEDDIVSVMRKSKMVIIMEDVSVTYRVSLWCKTTPYFYFMGFEGFRQMPASMILGRHLPLELRNKFSGRFLQIFAMKVPFVKSWERWPGHFDCVPSAQNQRSETTEALTWSDMEFPFYSHLMASGMTTSVLIAEILWEKFRRKVGLFVDE